MQEKTCIKCGETKPVTDFSSNGGGKSETNFSSYSSGWDVWKSTCKDCDAEYSRNFRKENPGYRGSGKITKYPKEERLLISAIRARLNMCKCTFRKRNGGECESDLDADYLYELYKKQEGRCVYTGVKLGLKKGHPATISIDKITPSKGYIKGNVQWVCWAANRAKGDLDEKVFLNMCRIITERCNDYPAREYTVSD